MIKARKPISPQNALSRLEDLCARSEQCSGEARKKLSGWGIAPTDAERIISALVERRFIDDSRFCRAFVRDKLYFARWGRRKILLSLAQKKISRGLASEAVDAIDPDDYLDILKKIVLAKAGTIKDADTYDGRTRLFRFALSRGFEPDLVAGVIRGLASGEDIR